MAGNFGEVLCSLKFPCYTAILIEIKQACVCRKWTYSRCQVHVWSPAPWVWVRSGGDTWYWSDQWTQAHHTVPKQRSSFQQQQLGQFETASVNGRWLARMCVCVCVCVWERESSQFWSLYLAISSSHRFLWRIHEVYFDDNFKLSPTCLIYLVRWLC